MENLLIEWWLRATVILALAWFAAARMRSAPAARRAALWRISVLAVLALPLLHGLRTPVPIPTGWTERLLPAAEADVAGSSPAAITSDAITSDGASAPTTVREPDLGRGEEASTGARRPVPASITTQRDLQVKVAERQSPARQLLDASAWRTASLIVWLLGAAMLLARLAMSVRAASALVRRAVPARDPLGNARIYESDEVESPMVFDLRPFREAVIVVPNGFGAVPSDPWARAALGHELAHVERRDGLTYLAAAGLRSLLWFHPLAHLAARRLRMECERACDDAALDTGIDRHDYAEGLVRATTGFSPAALPAMAARCTLEERVVALLEPSLRRGVDGRRARAVLWAVAAATFGSAGVLLPVLHASPSQAAATTARRTTTLLGDGLAVLVSQQDPATGSWRGDAGYRINERWRVTHEGVPHVGITGMALEALVLGRTRHPEIGPTVDAAIERATAFLLACQDRKGRFEAEGASLRDHAHALGGLVALARTCPPTPLERPIQDGVRFSLEALHDEADGWGQQPLSRRSDLTETAFHLAAIEAALAACPMDESGIRLAADFLATRARVTTGTEELLVEPAQDRGRTGRSGGYLEQRPESGQRVPRPTLIATAAGLFVEKERLAVEERRATAGLTALRALRFPNDGHRSPRHVLTMDAELLLTRVGRWPEGSETFRLQQRELLADTARWYASQCEPGGHWPTDVGPGACYGQAAACLVLALMNSGDELAFYVTVESADGERTRLVVDEGTSAIEAVALAELERPATEHDKLTLDRHLPPADPLHLAVDLPAVLRGDSSTNFPMRAGDHLTIASKPD